METSYLIKLLKEISDIMAENKDKLIEMDGIVGDGDLGLTMSDGFKAAYDAVSDGAIADAGKLLFAAGKAMANKVPSTMGSLMATGLKQAGKDLKGKETLEDADVVQIFASYEAGVAKLGEAKVGDKTYVHFIGYFSRSPFLAHFFYETFWIITSPNKLPVSINLAFFHELAPNSWLFIIK